MQVVFYDEPIIKLESELKKGEIIKTFFGDYDNIVTVCVEKVEKTPDNWNKLTGKYVRDNKVTESVCEMYSLPNDKSKVIGEVKE